MIITGLPAKKVGDKTQVEFAVQQNGDKLHFIMDADKFAASVGPSASGKDYGVSLAPATLTDENGTKYRFRISWVGVKAL
jgi:hypothetical protein